MVGNAALTPEYTEQIPCVVGVKDAPCSFWHTPGVNEKVGVAVGVMDGDLACALKLELLSPEVE